MSKKGRAQNKALRELRTLDVLTDAVSARFVNDLVSNDCVSAVAVLVEAARSRGIALEPVGTSLLAIDQQWKPVYYGARARDFLAREQGVPSSSLPLSSHADFQPGHLVARHKTSGRILDPTVGQLRSEGIRFPLRWLAFDPPTLGPDDEWAVALDADGNRVFAESHVSLVYFPYPSDESWRGFYERYRWLRQGWGEEIARAVA